MCIRWPTLGRMQRYALQFEQIKGIPHVVGAVDGSHIPIIGPTQQAPDYFNRKGFHSILLQVVVDAQCAIWDYDVGWAGSMHDWSLFHQSDLGQRCADGRLGKYCLVMPLIHHVLGC